MRRVTTILLLGACVALGLPATTAGAADTVWLCRPGLASNPCTTSRAATRVAADGTMSREPAPKQRKQAIDCFYVYPTVSLQPTPNANLDIEPNETGVALAQASRYSSVCKVYAPMYRQLTIAAIGGSATAEAAAIAYGDVRDAWRDYLAHDNHGRGVVLIGHSQGAGMLIQLLQREIDKKPKVRKRLVAAYLLGGNVAVPKGRDVGGDFAHVPACRKRTQTGCVVAFSTFNEPPPADAIFGRVNGGFNRVRGAAAAKSQILCVNPGALRGGSATVHAYFPAHTDLGVLTSSFPAGSLASVPTPWATFPGRYRAECKRANGASWLQVDEQIATDDTRPRLVNSLGPTWGLHLVDANIAVGDQVALVASQAEAWAQKH
jgi:Protein of unknown function (DUF3089)